MYVRPTKIEAEYSINCQINTKNLKLQDAVFSQFIQLETMKIFVKILY